MRLCVYVCVRARVCVLGPGEEPNHDSWDEQIIVYTLLM